VAGRACVVDRETGAVWLMIEPEAGLTVKARAPIADDSDPRTELDCVGQLAAGQVRTITLKLASPAADADAVPALMLREFAGSKAAAVRYWEAWLAQGARFDVPEPAVNDLFRANLWHALVLPRHRADA